MSAATEPFEKPDIVMVDDREERDTEKVRTVQTIDNIRVLGLSEEDAQFYQSYTTEDRKRVIRKVRGLTSIFKVFVD